MIRCGCAKLADVAGCERVQTLRDQLEAKMLADMVMELLASHADITYTDRVEA